MEFLDFPYRLAPKRAGAGFAVFVLAAILAASGCAVPSQRPAIGPSSVVATPAHPSRLAQPDGAEITVGVDHVVGPGQTLWRIARTYGVEVAELVHVNDIANPDLLEVGRVLFVPGALVVREVPPAPASLRIPDPPVAADVAEAEAVSEWLWPVRGGALLSEFGAPRRNHRHAGVDIRGEPGQPVLATRAGKVIYSNSTLRGYGKTVIVDHGDGMSSLYAHNSALLVDVGQFVDRGQTIARVGRTGNATTEHCHFEIRNGPRSVDPLPLLRPNFEARR